jgi:hypothetical protein
MFKTVNYNKAIEDKIFELYLKLYPSDDYDLKQYDGIQVEQIPIKILIAILKSIDLDEGMVEYILYKLFITYNLDQDLFINMNKNNFNYGIKFLIDLSEYKPDAYTILFKAIINHRPSIIEEHPTDLKTLLEYMIKDDAGDTITFIVTYLQQVPFDIFKLTIDNIAENITWYNERYRDFIHANFNNIKYCLIKFINYKPIAHWPIVYFLDPIENSDLFYDYMKKFIDKWASTNLQFVTQLIKSSLYNATFEGTPKEILDLLEKYNILDGLFCNKHVIKNIKNKNNPYYYKSIVDFINSNLFGTGVIYPFVRNRGWLDHNETYPDVFLFLIFNDSNNIINQLIEDKDVENLKKLINFLAEIKNYQLNILKKLCQNHAINENQFDNVSRDAFIQLPNGNIIDSESTYKNLDMIKSDMSLIDEKSTMCREALNKLYDASVKSVENLLWFQECDIRKVNRAEKREAIDYEFEKFINQNARYMRLADMVRSTLGKYLYTWGIVRMFIYKDDAHTAFDFLFNPEYLRQPELIYFLDLNINGDIIETNGVQDLLTIRNNAIRNNKIIPGTNNGEFPDNKAGLIKYKTLENIKYSNNDIKINDQQFEFLNDLTKYYDAETIIDFIQSLSISEEQFISPDETEIDGFTFKILEKNDPLGSVLGNITKCCQKIGGAGEACVFDGYENPNAGFLAVFFNEKVVAQSWLRLGTSKTLYLDNIETIETFSEIVTAGANNNLIKIKLFMETGDNFLKNYIYNDYKNNIKNDENIIKIKDSIKKWADYIKNKYKYTGVVVGSNFSDLKFEQYLFNQGINLKQEFGEYSSIYSDLRKNNNYKLSFNLRKNIA